MAAMAVAKSLRIVTSWWTTRRFAAELWAPSVEYPGVSLLLTKARGCIAPDWKAFKVAAGATGAEHSSASPWPHARVTAVNVAGNRPERHDANHWFVDWLQPVIGEERTRALHFKSC